MRRTSLVVVAAMAIAVGAAGDGAKRDQDKLEGSWVSTAITSAGKKVDAEVHMHFKGDKVTTIEKGGPAFTGTFKLDPAKSPPAIDITIEEKGKKRTVAAIYELKGDELRLCHSLPEDASRPRSFEATGKTVLVTFRRHKP